MSGDVIVEALRRAGATFEGESAQASRSALSKADMYALGLSGRPDSAVHRLELQRKLGLPQRMSANALMQALNILTDRQELEQLLTSGQ